MQAKRAGDLAISTHGTLEDCNNCKFQIFTKGTKINNRNILHINNNSNRKYKQTMIY
jgi:hypothetical protein